MKQQRRTRACFRPRAVRRPGHASRGQSLVEFALVFPVFMILVSGMIDFGFGFYSYMTVINGARVGARVAVLNPTDTNSAIEGAVNSEIVALNSSLVTISTQCQQSGQTTWVSCGSYTPKSGDTVAVTVGYTYKAILPIPFASSIPMSSTVQMRIE